MKRFYYSIATLTALICLSTITAVYDDNDTIKVQHIDMSEYPIFITGKKIK